MSRFVCKECGIDDDLAVEFHCAHCDCVVCNPDRERGAA